MSAVGIFALKFPALLKFEKEIRKTPNSPEAKNFKNLFGVKITPDDTSMRKTIVRIPTSNFSAPFKEIFKYLVTAKALQQFLFYRGTYLISIDGTGLYSSNKVSCNNCGVKKHRDGTVTYYHQMLAAAIVHPDRKQVIPLAPEPIQKQDGSNKNDCERNAVKRLLETIRKEDPRLDITVTEDALAANYPHIKEIQRHNMHFILGIKPGDHKNFFERLEECELAGNLKRFEVQDGEITSSYRYINDIIVKRRSRRFKGELF